MTNDEIAKDLTVAMIAKMTEPTPLKIIEAYREILQGLGRTAGTVTLESIELHLKKQDDQGALITTLIFGASTVIAGCAMATSAALKLDFDAGTIRFWGWLLMIVGVAIVVPVFVILKRKAY